MPDELVAPISGKVTCKLSQLPKWKVIVDRYHPTNLTSNFQKLNSSTNNIFQYQAERDDYWKSPDEFLRDKGGDCEDFAIFKFFALNIPRYIAVGELTDTRERHAVCAVYSRKHGDWVVLDCRTNDIVSWQEYIKKFTVVYVCDINGVYI